MSANNLGLAPQELVNLVDNNLAEWPGLDCANWHKYLVCFEIMFSNIFYSMINLEWALRY